MVPFDTFLARRRVRPQRRNSAILAEGTSCDAADVMAGQADVGQRVVGQVAEFAEGAAVAEPVLGDTDRVLVFSPLRVDRDVIVIGCWRLSTPNPLQCAVQRKCSCHAFVHCGEKLMCNAGKPLMWLM